jgi:hypothetical protein
MKMQKPRPSRAYGEVAVHKVLPDRVWMA